VRLRLEPVRADHADALYAGLQDPRIYEWISLVPPPSADMLRQRWPARFRDGDVIDLAWAVLRVGDGACIGKMDAEVLADGVATNVGYAFFPPFWGRGYASEAVRAVAECLARQGVFEQHATVTSGNEASCRVLERAGFVRERVLPGHDTIRGRLVDDIEYVRRDPRTAR